MHPLQGKAQEADEDFVRKKGRRPLEKERQYCTVQRKRAKAGGESGASPKGDESMRTIPVLSTANLRMLPEFKYNVFLERLVRIFCETGVQFLTLMEFIDLYSAFSRRAPLKWKAWIAYCIFDFDGALCAEYFLIPVLYSSDMGAV